MVLTLVFCFPLVMFAQTTIYVSPNGNDGNPGTLAKPLLSISAAVERSTSINNNVSIKLRQGTYYLKETLIFNASEAYNNFETNISPYQNEKVSVSGSTRLNLVWENYQNGIWQAHVSDDLVFDELYVNGKRQHMARYPNVDSTARFLGGTSADALSTERLAQWASPTGGYVHALHPAEWGDIHYRIKGINADGELDMEGGWQNNRPMGMHAQHRFVENIFEELDHEGEWYFNHETKMLYYYPSNEIDLQTAIIETPQLKHLIEFRGTSSNPIKNVSIEGIVLTQTMRTFMDNKEPLLRSDWTIYRGGAIVFDGAENCTVKNCNLINLGGNAVFFNKYNRNCELSGCEIAEIGASAVCFVGNPNAVRSPSFKYWEFVPLENLDLTPGPKNNNYPAECVVNNNLMYNLGIVEKQSAGVELSMCKSITVSHNTIYDVPRAGINVSEGTWGGHIIEYNDVFNTVKESGDHGSFNSWGRDRFWHPNKQVLDSIVEHRYELTMLDVVKPIIIQNNRFRCDHGWDIDLDDGSSNYIIKNNLCLNGGIKLREGVNRIVENNILINNTFHPHVWFKNSEDVFKHNILFTKYMPINIPVWGKEVDYNVFPDYEILQDAQKYGVDQHSIATSIEFIDAGNGDFRLADGSAAFQTGFRNFEMDQFGVTSERLKQKSKKVPLPNKLLKSNYANDENIEFMDLKVKNLTSLGERSATGMDTTRGVLIVSAGNSRYFKTNDVIISFNNKTVNNLKDLIDAKISVIGTTSDVIVFRNQQQSKITIQLKNESN